MANMTSEDIDVSLEAGRGSGGQEVQNFECAHGVGAATG